MRILLVNDYLEKIGGAEIYFFSLKNELYKRGHIVSIFGSEVSKNEYMQSNKKNIKKMIDKIFNIKAKTEFKKILDDFKPDIIHLNGVFNELSPSILMATKSIPVIMTVHDSKIVNAVSILSERTGMTCKNRTCGGCRNCVGWKGTIYEFVKRKIHKLLLKKISLYITPSKYMGELIQQAGFKPVNVIPNGIKLLRYSKITNFNKLLYVGRLTKEKGIEFLLRAMPEVIRILPDIELQLVGDGVDKNYFKEIARDLNILKNVNIAVAVPSSKIEKFYKESTLIVVPSIYPDNFPTVCIEAMSIGRPMIGTRVGGVPELIDDGNTGFLVSPTNSQELAEKIIYLLSNKNLLLQMSENALQKSSTYTLKDHMDKIEKLYKDYIK